MVLAFPLPNTNPSPQVSNKLKDGTKIVTVYDNHQDTNKSFKVKAEDADAYVNNRIKAMNKNKIAKGLLSLISCGAIFYGCAKRGDEMAQKVLLSLFGILPGCLIPDLIMPKSRLGRKETNKFINWAESKDLQYEKN